MTCECHDAIAFARDTGRLQQAVSEVGRCIRVFESAPAKRCPRLAWGMLPLGLDDDETIARVVAGPAETDSETLWQQFMTELYERLARVDMQLQFHLRRDAHVRH